MLLLPLRLGGGKGGDLKARREREWEEREREEFSYRQELREAWLQKRNFEEDTLLSPLVSDRRLVNGAGSGHLLEREKARLRVAREKCVEQRRGLSYGRQVRSNGKQLPWHTRLWSWAFWARELRGCRSALARLRAGGGGQRDEATRCSRSSQWGLRNWEEVEWSRELREEAGRRRESQRRQNWEWEQRQGWTRLQSAERWREKTEDEKRAARGASSSAGYRWQERAGVKSGGEGLKGWNRRWIEGLWSRSEDGQGLPRWLEWTWETRALSRSREKRRGEVGGERSRLVQEQLPYSTHVWDVWSAGKRWEWSERKSVLGGWLRGGVRSDVRQRASLGARISTPARREELLQRG